MTIARKLDGESENFSKIGAQVQEYAAAVMKVRLFCFQTHVLRNEQPSDVNSQAPLAKIP